MQWFKIPPKIYFEKGSTQYLEKMPNISKVLIVTDAMMVKLGYVEKSNITCENVPSQFLLRSLRMSSLIRP